METKKRLRVSLEDAWKALRELPARTETETLPPASCLGRVAAEDVRSREAVPPFAKAPLDGYAIRSADVSEASPEHPVTLRVNQEIAAGGVPKLPVGPGEAAKILTGAPMPIGADTVVRYENTEYTDSAVTLREPASDRKDVVPAGDDIAPGDLIIAKGGVITPPVMGLLSAVGTAEVRVFQRPTATLISTGSELTDRTGALPDGKIRNSSYALLKGYLEAAGAEARTEGIVPDDASAIAAAIARGLERSDMVVTTGGVSVGDYDLVLAATELLGARRLFWKVRFRPGGTMLAAELGGRLILGLSGNPASAALALHLLGIPFVKRLAGRTEQLPQRCRARLLGPIEKDSPFGRLVRGRMVLENGEVCFAPVDAQGNGALTSLLGCDLIADLPPETPPLPAGAWVEAYRI